MESILSSNKIALLINGAPTKWIKTRQGLQQGDPIFLLLFNLITDSLHRILLFAANNELIHGIAYSKSTSDVLCMQYADDTIIFNDSNLRHIQYLKFILYCFEIISGLRINFDKNVMYGINLPEVRSKQLATVLGCSLSSLPTNYLGFPLNNGNVRSVDWNFLVEKVDKKLSASKGKLLSLGGRLILVNSVLSASPTY